MTALVCYRCCDGSDRPALATAIPERQQLLAAAHVTITRASLRGDDRVRINGQRPAPGPTVPAQPHRHGRRLLRPKGHRVPGPATYVGCFVTGELPYPSLALDRPGSE